MPSYVTLRLDAKTDVLQKDVQKRSSHSLIVLFTEIQLVTRVNVVISHSLIWPFLGSFSGKVCISTEFLVSMQDKKHTLNMKITVVNSRTKGQ
jgi:hypothetical protein